MIQMEQTNICTIQYTCVGSRYRSYLQGGYTSFIVGLVHGREYYLRFYRITKKQNKVVIIDIMWARGYLQ
ncbi:putative 6-phosphofructokinase [Helianthus annuus]|nr:putative 6-phosphofructokinase [Helianthus annuus]KAJ0921817.1 putative 6-phosphofructokinase [Helianthus annuus]